MLPDVKATMCLKPKWRLQLLFRGCIGISVTPAGTRTGDRDNPFCQLELQTHKECRTPPGFPILLTTRKMQYVKKYIKAFDQE